VKQYLIRHLTALASGRGVQRAPQGTEEPPPGRNNNNPIYARHMPHCDLALRASGRFGEQPSTRANLAIKTPTSNLKSLHHAPQQLRFAFKSGARLLPRLEPKAAGWLLSCSSSSAGSVGSWEQPVAAPWF
jgi:hypothetical protein